LVRIKRGERKPVIAYIHDRDTVGQERHRSLAPMYFKGAHIIWLVYDITNPVRLRMGNFHYLNLCRLQSSLDGARDWAKEIRVKAPMDELPKIWIVTGNKCDLGTQREVMTEEGLELAKSLGGFFCETSAKDDENIKQLMHDVAQFLCALLRVYRNCIGASAACECCCYEC
jgi:GTPase SAR1 family protein